MDVLASDHLVVRVIVERADNDLVVAAEPDDLGRPIVSTDAVLDAFGRDANEHSDAQFSYELTMLSF
jgi:hypothetical protein